MNKLRIAIAAATGATLIGIAGCAPRRPPAPPPVQPPVAPPAARPLPSSAYLMKAASIDLYEIQAGELAQQRSGQAALRAYGRRMIEEHRGLAAQLSMAGRRLNLLPPRTLQPEQQQWLSQLAATASSEHFDATYRQQQIVAHDQSYRIHAAYESGGDSATLRMVAKNAATVEREHSGAMMTM